MVALAHASGAASLMWQPASPRSCPQPCPPAQLASSCYDGVVRLWDIRSASVPLHELPAHADKARSRRDLGAILPRSAGVLSASSPYA